jgi:hypothetical protein
VRSRDVKVHWNGLAALRLTRSTKNAVRIRAPGPDQAQGICLQPANEVLCDGSSEIAAMSGSLGQGLQSRSACSISTTTGQ